VRELPSAGNGLSRWSLPIPRGDSRLRVLSSSVPP
jgi:hypothetical protein